MSKKDKLRYRYHKILRDAGIKYYLNNKTGIIYKGWNIKIDDKVKQSIEFLSGIGYSVQLEIT